MMLRFPETITSFTRRLLLVLLVSASVAGCRAAAKERPATAPQHPQLDETEIVKPYKGPIRPGADASTLSGKVMCGYQGWFCMPGDGTGLGAVHWGDVLATPPRATVDLWPDMTELSEEERFITNFRHADGSPAYVFSSAVRKTVLRHFRWMQEYGIDGVFVQRFVAEITPPERKLRTNAVLSHCREGANRYGRTFAVMYDTDFDRASVEKIKADWRELVDRMRILDTPAYQKHGGAPVVALWGLGFPHRQFDAAATRELFEFFNSSENGGCTLMLGVDNDWRSWAEKRENLYQLLEQYADIIQPWNVGRYGTLEDAERHFAQFIAEDLKWCRERNRLYYPVVFPGFSWTNLRRGADPLNQIPRLQGRFFWRQVELTRQYGMDLAYIAMFDEVDEGTAIMKCTNNPPVGQFCTYEGLPSDHYLVLAGLAGKYLRGEDITLPHITGESPHLRQTHGSERP